MFHPEFVTSPWHYYVYRFGQEWVSTGDWQGKEILYHNSRCTGYWWDAQCESMKGHKWLLGCTLPPYVKDSRLYYKCADNDNVWPREKSLRQLAQNFRDWDKRQKKEAEKAQEARDAREAQEALVLLEEAQESPCKRRK